MTIGLATTTAADATSTTTQAVETTLAATPDWFESLPPELKTDKSLQAFKGKSAADVAKSYVEAQRMVGGSIRLPKPDATPADRAKFTKDILAKLGAPETPDKYTVTRPQIPESVPWDDNTVKAFLPAAHALGLLPEQVQGVVEWYGSKVAEGYLTRDQEYEKGEKALRIEWGGVFDRNLSLAKRFVMDQGGKEAMDAFERTGAGNDPHILRLLANTALAMSEKGLIRGDVDGVPGPADAQARIDAIKADKTHPWQKGDARAVEEMHNLYRILHGTKPVLTVG